MADEIAALAAYNDHPDTNRAVFEMLLDDCMSSDIEFTAIMKVVGVIMRDDQP